MATPTGASVWPTEECTHINCWDKAEKTLCSFLRRACWEIHGIWIWFVSTCKLHLRKKCEALHVRYNNCTNNNKIVLIKEIVANNNTFRETWWFIKSHPNSFLVSNYSQPLFLKPFKDGLLLSPIFDPRCTSVCFVVLFFLCLCTYSGNRSLSI